MSRKDKTGSLSLTCLERQRTCPLSFYRFSRSQYIFREPASMDSANHLDSQWLWHQSILLCRFILVLISQSTSLPTLQTPLSTRASSRGDLPVPFFLFRYFYFHFICQHIINKSEFMFNEPLGVYYLVGKFDCDNTAFAPCISDSESVFYFFT